MIKGDPFLDDTSQLEPGDAAAAILVTPDENYLLQLRDKKCGIFFPGHWGCFGGAVDPNDGNSTECLTREIREELGIDLTPESISHFTNYTFDLTFCGVGVIYRTFFEVHLSKQQLSHIRLNEGSAFRSFSARDALSNLRLVPYDAFALWMHANRSRLVSKLERI